MLISCYCVLSDVRLEDSGNYTCEISGPDNIILNQVTHSIYVRGLNYLNQWYNTHSSVIIFKSYSYSYYYYVS